MSVLSILYWRNVSAIPGFPLKKANGTERAAIWWWHLDNAAIFIHSAADVLHCKAVYIHQIFCGYEALLHIT